MQDTHHVRLLYIHCNPDSRSFTDPKNFFYVTELVCIRLNIIATWIQTNTETNMLFLRIVLFILGCTDDNWPLFAMQLAWPMPILYTDDVRLQRTFRNMICLYTEREKEREKTSATVNKRSRMYLLCSWTRLIAHRKRYRTVSIEFYTSLGDNAREIPLLSSFLYFIYFNYIFSTCREWRQ